MMKACFGFFIAATFLTQTSFAQDTLKLCTYNVLNYGNSANTHTTKKQWLQPILAEINSSLLGLQEVSTALPGATDSIMQLAPFPAAKGTIHNSTRTTQLNALLWDSTKFARLRDTSICNAVRDISAYELYYKSPDLSTFRDTIKLIVLVAHFKSSNTSADAATRTVEAECVSNYIASLSQNSNVLLMGDLNLYRSSETAYQRLTNPANPAARLNDPISTPGYWNGDPALSHTHTQSPRFSTIGDGGASGGLDSRFDFILMSDAIMTGTGGIQYVSGTYKAVGNDGQHFNKNLTDVPLNTSVSYQMAQNLYFMSDHLPVVAGFVFTPRHLAISSPAITEILQVENPFGSSIRLVRSGNLQNKALLYTLYSIDGKIIQSGEVSSSDNRIELKSALPESPYFLHMRSGESAGFYKLTNHF